MFTSNGNIRRKRKAPRVPPKPNSDRMVMKKLREERIRHAGADELGNQVNLRQEDFEDQQEEDDEVNYNDDLNQQPEDNDNSNSDDSDNDN